MKPLCLAAALTLAASLAHAQTPPPSIALPAPKTDGKVAVEKALKDRRSLRTPSPDALALADVGQLCWAAQGTTDDKGHRTTPSAMATYPLELYVLAGNVTGLAPGLYRYQTAKHELVPLKPGDRRAELVDKAIGQDWIKKAPAVFFVTGVVARATVKIKDEARAKEFLWQESGLVAQAFFLEATAMGLGSTFVGGYKAEPTREFLALPAGEAPLAVLPVGKRP
ncbi:MAG TPA: SagB/ThcOx family dehydrogenase [Myxococcales bacterium]|jgi:SagB-type dehydrogenase family enzyme